MSSDKERHSHVYVAKLAEQAERYDGSSSHHPQIALPFSSFPFFMFLGSGSPSRVLQCGRGTGCPVIQGSCVGAVASFPDPHV
ncbi:hypothetical protein MLD38_005536 [Melastoma candidum]|uniref:Uncharacterized protein n=1 Tax=Melastoma candidum TaxID=119954 RepID=A0ACB9RLW9_9MYRT|nr:hypothetical protein MLD38_005536 [Melastoma candidum]